MKTPRLLQLVEVPADGRPRYWAKSPYAEVKRIEMAEYPLPIEIQQELPALGYEGDPQYASMLLPTIAGCGSRALVPLDALWWMHSPQGHIDPMADYLLAMQTPDGWEIARVYRQGIETEHSITGIV